MKTFQVGAHSVRASDDPGKPAIMLLRMASRDAGLWDAVWRPLERWFRVVQFDLPMPSLEALERPHDAFGELARTAREIALELGHPRFSVFGWNGGCHVALRCAGEWPDAVERCVLLGPFHAVGDPRPIRMGLEFLRALFQRGDARLYAYYWYLGGLSPGFAATRFDEIERWVERRVSSDRFLAQSPERAMKWMHALRGAWMDEEALRAIAAPTLILAPTLNLWHAGPTLEMAEALHTAIPGSELVRLEQSGSLVLLEDPQRVLAPIAEFLERRSQ